MLRPLNMSEKEATKLDEVRGGSRAEIQAVQNEFLNVKYFGSHVPKLKRNDLTVLSQGCLFDLPAIGSSSL